MEFFICKHCNKKFTNSLTLRKHIEVNHKPRKKRVSSTPKFKFKKNSSIHPMMKQLMKEERIRKHRETQIENVNNLEKFMMQILSSLNIKYVFQYEHGGKLFDFYLPEYNVLLETDGDYWHCNPKTQGKPKYANQKRTIRNDKKKNKLCEQSGITLIRYWESDINKNLEWVMSDLLSKLGKN
jgi:very-short-patch-repair endonuclease